MVAPRKYPDELRERATRMAMDARQNPATRTGAYKRVADQLGVHPEALRTWVKRAEVDEGLRPGTTSDDSSRLAELEREVKELRRANTILRQASAFFAAELDSPTQVKVEFIDRHKAEHGVQPICDTLKDTDAAIAPSTYYATKSRPESARQSGGMADDRQVGKNTGDVVAEASGLTARWAGRVVFDGRAVDVSEPFRDGGARDGDTEFDGSADGIGDKVGRLQVGSWMVKGSGVKNLHPHIPGPSPYLYILWLVGSSEIEFMHSDSGRAG